MKKSSLKKINDYRREQVSKKAVAKDAILPLREKILNYRRFTLPLNNPDTVSASEAFHMDDEDLVTGVIIGQVARAYPWWILSNYHVSNDVLNNEPILVTLCEACGASTAFKADVKSRWFSLDFSSAIAGMGFGTFNIGDLQTKSVWHPFLGISIAGPLVGTKLKRLETQLCKWGDWKKLHPNTDIIFGSMNLRKRTHGLMGSRTIGESGMSDDLRRVSNMSDNRLPSHSIVFGVNIFTDSTNIGTHGAQGKAYDIQTLTKHSGIIYDKVAGEDVFIVKTSDVSMRGFKRSLDGQLLTFKIISNLPFILKDQSGNLFDEWGNQLNGANRKKLIAIDGYLTEWYEWVSAFPNSEVYFAK